MKARLVIGALAILCVLSSVLSGCSHNGGESESIYSEDSSNALNCSDIIGNTSDSSDSSNSSDYGDCSIKASEKVIDSEGIAFGNANEMRDLYMTGMDNNYVYFSACTFPDTILGVDRKDLSKTEVMTYNIDIEYGDSNKNTYCGCYFTFPCYGNAYYGDVSMKVYVGKVGEQSKCILNKKVGSSIVADPAELNDTEMVFLCDSELKSGLLSELYKYRIGDEQAKQIYTLESDWRAVLDVTCHNDEIYIIYKISRDESNLQTVSNNSETTLYCIKRLNSEGEEIDNEVFELPFYPETVITELTVSENNYILRLWQRHEESKTIIIDRKSKNVAIAVGSEGVGSRANDHIIDDRYIIFFGNLTSDFGPQICVFDDKKSEIHILSFKSLKGKYIVNTAVDYNGDVLFQIQDDTQSEDTRSLVIFKDVISLI